jgi:hypothetical protein
MPACKKMPQPNAKANIAVGGLCERCPSVRLDTLLRRLEGVVDVRIDTTQGTVQLDYDSTYITPTVIGMILNDAGYDADDSPAFAPGLMDVCCTTDTTRNGALRNKRNGKTLADSDPELDDSLSLELDHILGANGEQAAQQAGLLLDEMDPDLESVLEEDILNEIELSQLELANPEVGDEILDEDPESAN